MLYVLERLTTATTASIEPVENKEAKEKVLTVLLREWQRHARIIEISTPSSAFWS